MGDALIIIDPIELERITKEVLLEFPAHRVPAEVLRRCSVTAPKITAADRRRAGAAVAHAVKKRTG